MSRVLTTLLSVALLSAACTPAPNKPDPGTFKGPLFDAANDSAELSKAVSLLEEGECSRAVGYLSVYTGQDSTPGLVDYLLAHAHFCSGDYLKAAHHTHKAWDAAGSNQQEVAAFAMRLLQSIAAQGKTRSSAELAHAAWMTARMELPLKADSVLLDLVRVHSERLAARGELKGATEGLEAMRRLGATLADTLLLETLVQARLGKVDEFIAKVEANKAQLGPKAPDLLAAAGAEAEKAFRADLASWLYRQAADMGSTSPTLALDIARTDLQLGQVPQAVESLTRYVGTTLDEAGKARLTKAVELLTRFSRFAEAGSILAQAIKKAPAEFDLVLALVNVAVKHPELGTPLDLFSQYLVAAAYSEEAVVRVGDYLLEARLCTTLTPLSAKLQDQKRYPWWSAFYQGACELQAKQDAKAQNLFKQAADKAPATGPVYRRIAAEYRKAGRLDLGIAWLERALKERPGNIEALLLLADLKEQQTPRSGVDFLETQARSLKPTGEGALAMAAWFASKQEWAAGLPLANTATQSLPQERVWEAWAVASEIQLRIGRVSEACTYMTKVIDLAPDRTVAAGRLLALTEGATHPKVACVRAAAVEALGSPATIPVEWLSAGSLAGMYCGKPSPELIRAYLASLNKGLKLIPLLEAAVDKEAAATLIEVVQEQSTTLDLGTEAWGRLALLAARRGLLDSTAGFVTRFLASPPIQVSVMQDLAQTLALYGARDEARRILEAAFRLSSADEREEIGISYAASLLSLGKEAEGFAVIQDTVQGAPYHASAAVKLVMLLLEAGKPAFARSVAVNALQNPGVTAAILGTIRDKVVPEGDPAPGSKEEALMKLLSNLSSDLATEADPASRLIFLAVYAAWLEKASPSQVVAQLEPLATKPELRNALAASLLRFGWADAASPLLEKALQQTPSDMTLLQTRLSALLLEAQLRGKPVESLQDEIRTIVKQTLLARENSADGQQTLAFWLADYGLNSLSAEMLTNLKAAGRLTPKVLVRFGGVLLTQGRLSEALANFQEALTSSNCDPDNMSEIHRLLARGSNSDEALKLLTECANRYPRSAARWWLIVTLLLDQPPTTDAQKAAALDAADKVLKNKADRAPEVIRLLAEAGLMPQAMELIRAGVEKGPVPEIAGILESAFPVFAKNGNTAEMERLANIAAKRYGSDSETLTALASLLFEYELWAPGLALLKQAAKPDNPSTMGLLGLREIGSGDKEAGLKHIFAWLDSELDLAKHSNDGRVPEEVSRLLYLLHSFLEDGGDVKLAQELIDRAVKRYPQDPKARITLLGHLTAGNPETFFEEWERLTLCPLPTPDEIAGMPSLLSRMRRLGLLERGAEVLQRDWDNRRNIESLPYLVHTLAAMRNRTVLLKVVDEALRTEWGDPYLLSQLGILLVERDLAAEAEPLLLQALRVAPSDPELVTTIHRALCRAYVALNVRSRLQEVHRMILLQRPESWDLREALVGNLADYGYYPEAEQQLRFLLLGQEDVRDSFERLVRLASLQDRPDEAWRLILIASYGLPDAGFGMLYRFLQGAVEGLQNQLASSLASRLYAINPNWEAVAFLASEQAFWAGKNDEAIQIIEKVLAAKPFGANLADAVDQLVKFGHLGKAMRLASKHPQDAAVQRKLAKACFLAQRPTEGAAYLQAAVQKDPVSGVRFLEQMLLFPHLLPPDSRQLVLDKSCSAGRGPAACLLFKGIAQLDMGDPAAAMKLFVEAGQGTTAKWPISVAAVRALLRANRSNEAWELLEKARHGLRLKDVNSQLFTELTDFVTVEQPPKEVAKAAIELFLKSLQPTLDREPDDFWLRSQKAEALLALGQIDEVRNLYELLLKDSPWESGANNNLAYFLSNQGIDLDKGIALIKEAMRLDAASNVFYLDTLGWLLFKQGKPKEAQPLIEQSLALSAASFGRNLSEVLWHLAEVRFANGDKKGAVEALWQASYRDPEGHYGRMARQKLRSLNLDPYRIDEK